MDLSRFRAAPSARLVAQGIQLVLWTVPQLNKCCDCIPAQFQRGLEIMVACDQALTRSRKLFEDLA